MVFQNPDVEEFRKMVVPLLAELRIKPFPEQRAMFDANMQGIPLADGCVVESGHCIYGSYKLAE